MPYVHVVFTLPHALLPLAYRNSARLYTWLFQASAATLREVAADPRHLGAEIGVLSILHTWGQTLGPPSARALRRAGRRALARSSALDPPEVRGLLPPREGPQSGLSREVCRGVSARVRPAGLDLAGGSEHLRDPAQWRAFVDALFETDWVVYAKPAFGGASAVLRYLGRYTHRVAISNHRLLAFDGDHVTFSLEGLRPWRPAPHDDALGHGVSAPLRPAHPAARLRPHPAVGLSREHLSRRPRRARAHAARHAVVGAPVHGRDRDVHHRAGHPRHVDVSACGAAMIVGPILSALHLATVTLGFDTS